MERQFLHGVMGEFESADSLLAATRRAYGEGYRRMDAYSPYPVDGLAEALHFRKTYIPLVVLAGGIIGAISGYGLEYYVSVISYPINVGGRPYNSWAMFVPVVFEMTILVAALFAVFGMLAFNGLPMPYHPVFNVPRFAMATRDRFFLVILKEDPLFDERTIQKMLLNAGAREVTDVPI